MLVGQEGLGQTGHLAEPVHDDRLQLGARRTGGPREADDAEAAGQHVAESGRIAVAGRKVGM